MNSPSATNILIEALGASDQSVEDLAAALRMPIPTVSGWLEGREELDVLTLARALDALDQPPETVGRALCAVLNVAA